MFDFIRKLFNKPAKETFVYCLTGNIILERISKSQNKIVRGTLHFSPGSKVYCFPIWYGEPYEKMKVIGRHRKTTKFATMIIPSEYITNWRIKAVYNPFIVKEMSLNSGWTNDLRKKWINEALVSLNKGI